MRKEYQGGKRIQGALCRILVTVLLTGLWLTVVPVIGLGAVYVSDDLYDDWNEDEDEEIGPGRSIMTEPGVSQAVVVEEQTGPSLTQVTLSEQYHSDYQIYEESMGNQFFFYSSVGNGGITDKAVSLDIPKNIRCMVEKDGEEYPYVPGQTISGYGTYVVKLTAIENPDAPFSEQKEYTALFRFRIQEKPPETTQEAAAGGMFPYGEEGSETGYIPGQTADPFGSVMIMQPQEETAEETRTEESAENGETENPEQMSEEPEETSEALEDTSGEETESDQEGQNPDESAENLPQEEGMLPEEQAASQSTYGARSQVYDRARGRYEITFENGRTVTANIPEGYVGPAAVELGVPEGEFRLYRDDELMEYTGDGSLTEPGHYRLVVDGQAWSFTIASAVRQMEYYPAPANMEFASVAVDGETRPLSTGRYVSLEEDGQYQILMTGQEGEVLEVYLKKDTQPPQAAVRVSGGRADIQYLSDDIDEIVLEKNGEVQKGFSGYMVNSPGSYKLTLSDEAGNASSWEFTLKYRMNTYAILAIVLVILLIAGAAVFVVHMKKNVKVR